MSKKAAELKSVWKKFKELKADRKLDNHPDNPMRSRSTDEWDSYGVWNSKEEDFQDDEK